MGGGDWEDEQEQHDWTDNPHGYTQEPEERGDDDDNQYAAAPYLTQAPSPSPAPAPEPVDPIAPTELPPAPPPAPPPVAAVVSIEAARQKRAPAITKLPDVAGLASFRTDYPTLGDEPLLRDLRKSALTDATIEAARVACLPAAKWRAYGFTCKPNNDPHAYDDNADIGGEKRAQAAGLLIPFFAPGAAEPHGYRLRPDTPIPVPPKKPGQKKRFKKYDQPYGSELLVYTPPLAACVDQLRGNTPLYWTEGEKKALLMAQLGLCVVGLTGVESWSQSGSKSSALHPYIAKHYGIAGREHVIVFDSDAMINTNVLGAMRKLAGMLLHLGATNVSAALPPLEYIGKTSRLMCKGVDDFAHAHGVDKALEHLLETRDEIAAVSPRVNERALEKVSAFEELTRGRDLVIPSPYAVDENGAVWLHTGFEDEAKRLITPRPILVTRVFTDMHRNGEYRVELQFQTSRGNWQAVTVPRALAGSRMLSAELLRHGALVDDTSIAEVIKWLTAWQARNGKALEPVRCVDRAGWCEDQFALGLDRVFAPAGKTPLAFDMQYDQSRLFTALGSNAENVEVAVAAHAQALNAAATASNDCAIAIYAALTAPLLRPFNLPNFAVHLCGDSSKGKTSMLRCAASVYGDPNNAAWVPSWNTTLNGLEQHAAQLCDLPVCFDEAGAGDPDAIQTGLYMLINGVGRQRMTRELTMRRTLSWQTVVISTGERELATEQAATGAQVRVISLPIDGFGELDATGVDAIRNACSAHAGAFGMAWLQHIVDIAADPTRLLRARERLAIHRESLQAIARRSGNPLNARIADYFAAMMFAEGMAVELGLSDPGERSRVQRVFELRCSDTDDLGGGAPQTLHDRVLDALEGWPASAPSTFPQLTESTDGHGVDAATSSRQVVNGYLREDGAVCFLPDSLKEFLAAKQLPWTRAVMRGLVKTGRLVREPSAQHATCRIRVNGRRIRVYILTPHNAEGFAS